MWYLNQTWQALHKAQLSCDDMQHRAPLCWPWQCRVTSWVLVQCSACHLLASARHGRLIYRLKGRAHTVSGLELAPPDGAHVPGLPPLHKGTAAVGHKVNASICSWRRLAPAGRQRCQLSLGETSAIYWTGRNAGAASCSWPQADSAHSSGSGHTPRKMLTMQCGDVAGTPCSSLLYCVARMLMCELADCQQSALCHKISAHHAAQTGCAATCEDACTASGLSRHARAAPPVDASAEHLSAAQVTLDAGVVYQQPHVNRVTLVHRHWPSYPPVGNTSSFALQRAAVQVSKCTLLAECAERHRAQAGST